MWLLRAMFSWIYSGFGAKRMNKKHIYAIKKVRKPGFRYSFSLSLPPFVFYSFYFCRTAIYTEVSIFSAAFVWTQERNPLALGEISFISIMVSRIRKCFQCFTAAAKRTLLKTVFCLYYMMYGMVVKLFRNNQH